MIYGFRFKREEVKIEAWENHQKAKTEAEMRRIEVCDSLIFLFYLISIGVNWSNLVEKYVSCLQ